MVAVQVIDTVTPRLKAALPRIEAQKAYYVHLSGDIVKESIEAEILRLGLVSGADEAHDPRKTIHLKDSVRVFYQTKNGVSVGTGRGLAYAEPLELGSQPHGIDATAADNLEFWWENEGLWFVGPHVNHPGNRPYRYVYQGTLHALVDLASMWQRYLRAVFGVPTL